MPDASVKLQLSALWFEDSALLSSLPKTINQCRLYSMKANLGWAAQRTLLDHLTLQHIPPCLACQLLVPVHLSSEGLQPSILSLLGLLFLQRECGQHSIFRDEINGVLGLCRKLAEGEMLYRQRWPPWSGLWCSNGIRLRSCGVGMLLVW